MTAVQEDPRLTSVTASAWGWAPVLAVLVAVLAALPYAAGWLPGAVVRACLWVGAAVRLGWRDGRGPA